MSEKKKTKKQAAAPLTERVPTEKYEAVKA